MGLVRRRGRARAMSGQPRFERDARSPSYAVGAASFELHMTWATRHVPSAPRRAMSVYFPSKSTFWPDTSRVILTQPRSHARSPASSMWSMPHPIFEMVGKPSRNGRTAAPSASGPLGGENATSSVQNDNRASQSRATQARVQGSTSALMADAAELLVVVSAAVADMVPPDENGPEASGPRGMPPSSALHRAVRGGRTQEPGTHRARSEINVSAPAPTPARPSA